MDRPDDPNRRRAPSRPLLAWSLAFKYRALIEKRGLSVDEAVKQAVAEYRSSNVRV